MGRAATAQRIGACLLVLLAAACTASRGGGGPTPTGPPRSPTSNGVPATGTPTGTPSTQPSTQSSTPTSTPESSPPLKGVVPPSRAQRIDQLTAQTNGEAARVVAVPGGGYEAATFDQAGRIQFWRNPSDTTTWTQIGSSRYPYVRQLGPPHAKVRATVLEGMTHATFIVEGVFTGDGSGNAVAFTNGANGWGAIKAEPNGNIGPSGSPVGSDRIGLSYGFGFAGGDLVTSDCPQNRPIAQCDTNQIVKRWAWNGTDFELASS